MPNAKFMSCAYKINVINSLILFFIGGLIQLSVVISHFLVVRIRI